MVDFFEKFKNFVSGFFGGRKTSPGSVARERLRLVLIQDRSSVSPQLLETLKEEMIEVISKYLEIDTQCLEVGFEYKESTVALHANIPIIRVKRSTPIPKLVESHPQEAPQQATMTGYPTSSSTSGTRGNEAKKRKEYALAGKRGKGKRRYRQ